LLHGYFLYNGAIMKKSKKVACYKDIPVLLEIGCGVMCNIDTLHNVIDDDDYMYDDAHDFWKFISCKYGKHVQRVLLIESIDMFGKEGYVVDIYKRGEPLYGSAITPCDNLPIDAVTTMYQLVTRNTRIATIHAPCDSNNKLFDTWLSKVVKGLINSL
jgi:hypothetical protein